MKMDVVAGSGNDEFYTPPYAVEPILRHLPVEATVWCPFDTRDSNFVKMLVARGTQVIRSHISEGDDFFKICPSEEYDYIVSNPPYSMKNEVFERLFSLKKPFAMLVGVVGLFESNRRFSLFRDQRFEIMYLSRRVAYFKDFSDEKPSLNPPFSSVYLTSGVLPQQIVFEEVAK
jgi:hypothetical protein